MMKLAVVLADRVHQEVMHYVHKAKGQEVSGFGLVEIEQQPDHTILYVRELCPLTPQENTGSSSEIAPEDFNRLDYSMKDKQGKMRWWWHSHHTMPVFWSGDDKKVLGELSQCDWLVATVFNQKDEMRSCFIQDSPIRFMVDDLETTVYRGIPQKLIDKWDAQFEKCNKVKTYASPPGKSKWEKKWDKETGYISGYTDAVDRVVLPFGQQSLDLDRKTDLDSMTSYGITKRELLELPESVLENMGIGSQFLDYPSAGAEYAADVAASKQESKIAQLQIMVLDKCIEFGLTEEDATPLLDRVETLVTDGKMSDIKIEQALVQLMLRKQAEREEANRPTRIENTDPSLYFTYSQRD